MNQLDINDSIVICGQFYVVQMITSDGFFLSNLTDFSDVIFSSTDDVSDMLGDQNEE